MGEMVTRGVFTGDVDGVELNIQSTTEVTRDRVTIEHAGITTGRRVVDTFTNRRDVRLLTYLEQRRAELARADARRRQPVTPNWKPARSSATPMQCADCDGSGEHDGVPCRACAGNGWR